MVLAGLILSFLFPTSAFVSCCLPGVLQTNLSHPFPSLCSPPDDGTYPSFCKPVSQTTPSAVQSDGKDTLTAKLTSSFLMGVLSLFSTKADRPNMDWGPYQDILDSLKQVFPSPFTSPVSQVLKIHVSPGKAGRCSEGCSGGEAGLWYP